MITSVNGVSTNSISVGDSSAARIFFSSSLSGVVGMPAKLGNAPPPAPDSLAISSRNGCAGLRFERSSSSLAGRGECEGFLPGFLPVAGDCGGAAVPAASPNGSPPASASSAAAFFAAFRLPALSTPLAALG